MSASDLVGRCRTCGFETCLEAANRITELEARVRELEREHAELESAYRISIWNRLRDKGWNQDKAIEKVNRSVAEVKARAALNEEKGGGQ